MKNFFKQLLLILVPTFVITGINYSIDYRSDGSKFIQNFVQEINLNDSINVYSNLPERMIVKERILRKNISSKIVLGSSRSLLMGKPIELEVTNLSVSGAILKDFKFIYHYLKKSQIEIDTLYIEISPWILNNNNKEKRYKEFIDLTIKEKIKKFTSFRYFFDNISPNKYSISVNSKDYVWYKDGAIKIDAQSRLFDLKKIKEYVRDEVYHLNGFNDIAKLDISEFNSFIDEIQNDKVKLIFVKHPYPPLINDKIILKYPNILKTEILIDSIALSKKINILGSFNPKKNNLENIDYYDGMHMTTNGIKKLLNLNKHY
jgi:hypothetical protein